MLSRPLDWSCYVAGIAQGQLEEGYKLVRILHLGFLTSMFLFAFILSQLETPQPGDALPVITLALVALCAGLIGVMFMLRRKILGEARNIFSTQPQNEIGIRAKYQLAYILTFAFCEAIVLYGFVLKLLGSTWEVFAAFWLTGFLLLLYFRPKRIEEL